MEIAESIYEVVVLAHMPNVLVTAGNREETPPHQKLTARRVKLLASTSKGL